MKGKKIYLFIYIDPKRRQPLWEKGSSVFLSVWFYVANIDFILLWKNVVSTTNRATKVLSLPSNIIEQKWWAHYYLHISSHLLAIWQFLLPTKSNNFILCTIQQLDKTRITNYWTQMALCHRLLKKKKCKHMSMNLKRKKK